MASIHEGRVLFAGSPDDAVSTLDGRIWRKIIQKADLKDHDSRFRIISIKLIAGRPLIHVYSAEPPGDGFESVHPDLEDVFFSRIAGHR
jgi:ABC-2 type transport system ATP-binding protein